MQGKVQGRGLKQTLTNENGNVTPIYPNDKLGDRAFKPAGGLFLQSEACCCHGNTNRETIKIDKAFKAQL